MEEPLPGFDRRVDAARAKGKKDAIRTIGQLGAIALMKEIDIDKVEKWIRHSHKHTDTVFVDLQTRQPKPDRDVFRSFSAAIGYRLYETLIDHVEADYEDNRLHSHNLNPDYKKQPGPDDWDQVGTLSPHFWGAKDCYSISLEGRPIQIPRQPKGIDKALRIMSRRIEAARLEVSMRFAICDRTLQLLGYKNINAKLRHDWTQDFALQQTLSAATGFSELVRTAARMPEFDDLKFTYAFQRLAEATLPTCLEIVSTYRAQIQHGLMNIVTTWGTDYSERYKPKRTGIVLTRDANATSPSAWIASVPELERPAAQVGLCPAQPDRPIELDGLGELDDADLELIQLVDSYRDTSELGIWFHSGATPIANLTSAVVLCCAEGICDDFGIRGETIGGLKCGALHQYLGRIPGYESGVGDALLSAHDRVYGMALV